MTQYANFYRGALHATLNGLLVWINKTCDGPGAHNVAGIIKHLLDRTSPNIIFIWSGEVILGLGFASPNITLPDQINMILVSVLSNKCILLLNWCLCILHRFIEYKWALFTHHQSTYGNVIIMLFKYFMQDWKWRFWSILWKLEGSSRLLFRSLPSCYLSMSPEIQHLSKNKRNFSLIDN